MTAEDKRGPGLRFPPPLLLLAVIACAWAIDWIVPLPIGGGTMPWRAGMAIIAIALLIALFASYRFFAEKTHIEPWHPATTIIHTGVYRFSRNPIYLGFCIAAVGAGLMLNSWWVVASAAPLKSLLLHLVISREESYLERKFGDRYIDYRKRVRRWL